MKTSRRNSISLLLSIMVVLALFFSCSQKGKTPGGESSATIKQTASEDTLLASAKTYFAVVPSVVPNPDNKITPQKVALGKELFFDTRLSKSNTISCNSCHNLVTYGVDNNPRSMGHGWKLGGRNAPTVLNAALHIAQFWDGRAKDVEEQAKGPIMNPVEMAMGSQTLAIDRIASIKQYVDQFKEIYPNQKNPVTYDNIANVIGAFERTLTTPSRFDRYLNGDENALTMNEKIGLQEFINAGCTSCHNGVAIGGGMYQKFGLDMGPYWNLTKSKVHDLGRYDVTKKDGDKSVFKVPSMRNIVHTYPYFHDGSVWDLKQAVHIMGQSQLGENLTESQINEIVAFLNSLTGEIPKNALELPLLPPSGPDTPRPDDAL